MIGRLGLLYLHVAIVLVRGVLCHQYVHLVPLDTTIGITGGGGAINV